MEYTDISIPIARLVFRGGDDKDGLIIGAALSGHNFFKPGMVYDMRNFMGQIIIKELGHSTVTDNVNDTDNPTGVSWNSEIGHVLEMAGKYMFITQAEYANLTKERNNEQVKEN